ncbi:MULTISPECIES: AraC-like ligand-binding domain-containing protein [Microbacterium]|uniref:AraC-like ligand-binding domain-containing protein n=2 Tax=Microbacteriaceae TaxID=85023 RepID=UPI0010F5E995|nr:helix-turn-helix domain-containing protein [Microbacterium sp. 4NA327F11]MCK9920186.1 helix-turn-helix domain-containing protein [Microbacteriaceae bacterium K1510]
MLHATPSPLHHIDSFTAFRENVRDTFVPLQVSSRRPHHFHAAARSAELRDLKIVEIAADPHVVERTRRLVAESESEPSYKVSLMVEGSGFICQDGRDVVLSPGDIAVYDTTRPYTLAFDDSSIRTIVAMFPKRLVDLSDDRIARLTATALGKDDHLGSMVGGVLLQLAGRLEAVSTATGWRLARNAVDLVNILLRDSLPATEGAGGERLIDRIYSYIDAVLEDPGVTPSLIADAHFISVRYLHSLFQSEGMSVGSYIRLRRIERCRDELADPDFADMTVTAIAARWSFADVAHFSRTFKSVYGETPSEFRSRMTRR